MTRRYLTVLYRLPGCANGAAKTGSVDMKGTGIGLREGNLRPIIINYFLPRAMRVPMCVVLFDRARLTPRPSFRNFSVAITYS